MIDWPSYNQSLVRRGQVLLDFDVSAMVERLENRQLPCQRWLECLYDVREAQ
jgi:hypothetical protein